MAYTLQQTINFCQPFIQYSPLTAGVANEPAISIANMVLDTITMAPFTWGWNRNEYSSLTLVTDLQDYNAVPITDFGYLEKVSLTNAAGTYAYEIKDVYNSNALGVSVGPSAEPKSVSVKSIVFGTSISLRFLAIPDQAYTSVITYQKVITPLSALTGASGTWPLPSQYADIYNNLFLAEAFSAVDDDQSAARYRLRGVAALLSKAEGLTEMQRNMFLSQYLARDSQAMISQLRNQQATQARAV
jgi:uncharacterized protein YqiB (DUF1249 family)